MNHKIVGTFHRLVLKSNGKHHPEHFHRDIRFP